MLPEVSDVLAAAGAEAPGDQEHEAARRNGTKVAISAVAPEELGKDDIGTVSAFCPGHAASVSAMGQRANPPR